MSGSNDDAVRGLCMEILDAVMVVAARGWNEARVRFAPAGGELRLADVHATVRSAPPRPAPDLGEEHGAFLGVIHEAANELRAAAGGAWDGAALVFSRGVETEVGATVVLENTGGAVGRTVALAARDVDALFFTEALFDALLDAEVGAEPRQRALAAELAGHDDWSYEAATQTLAFAKGVLPWRSMRAEVIGSWARESGSWLWGWANGSVPRAASAGVSRLRDEARTARGLGMLWRPTFPCSEGLSARLANLAAVRTGARGVYRGSYGPGWIFFAIE